MDFAASDISQGNPDLPAPLVESPVQNSTCGQISDQDLLRAVSAGESQALKVLIDRYDRLLRYSIYRTAPSYCQRDPQWLDARASEVWSSFVTGLRERKDFSQKDLRAYFAAAGRNKAVDAIRSRRFRPTADSEREEELNRLPAKELSPDELVGGLEQVEALRGCIAALDAKDRSICSHIELLTASKWRTAAEKLGMSESTLRSRWKAITGRLAVCLKKKMK